MVSAPGMLPRHVAIIMDGNGRWALDHGLPRKRGHEKGAESVRDVVRAAREWGLGCLTLYAFSSQNWQRPPDEVESLMWLLRDYVIEEREEIMDNNIRLTTIGDTGRLPPFVRDPLEKLMADSADNTSMILCLALSYGARESIVAAANAAAEAKLPLTIEDFEKLLPTSKLPPLDLLIRTSGERRISNFLLWEAAYAEFYFTEKLWPEFRRDELRKAIDDFEKRERRFGLTSEQLKTNSCTTEAE